MSFYNNPEHFLHKKLNHLESIGIEGKGDGFTNYLNEKGIPCEGSYWQKDHSKIDWNKVDNHYQFFFDYIGNENQISEFLRKSIINQYKFLETWISWEDPIVRILTKDFIENWDDFQIAGVDGLVLISEDGKYFLEFTDDWKYHLNSNFVIKV